MTIALDVVTNIRAIRAQKNLSPKDALTLQVISDDNFHPAFNPVIEKLANTSSIETITEKPTGAAAFIVKTTEYFVPVTGAIDVAAEMERLTKELEYTRGFLNSVLKKLSNERFVAGAPAQVVETERAKQADAEGKIKALEEQIAALK